MEGADVVIGYRADDSYFSFAEHFDCTDAYWAGWMLARYQWYSGKRFADILETVTFQDLLCLYPTMHEADPEKCYEVLDLHFDQLPSRLKTLRRQRHLTQEALLD